MEENLHSQVNKYISDYVDKKKDLSYVLRENFNQFDDFQNIKSRKLEKSKKSISKSKTPLIQASPRKYCPKKRRKKKTHKRVLTFDTSLSQRSELKKKIFKKPSKKTKKSFTIKVSVRIKPQLHDNDNVPTSKNSTNHILSLTPKHWYSGYLIMKSSNINKLSQDSKKSKSKNRKVQKFCYFSSIIQPHHNQIQTYSSIIPSMLKSFKSGINCCLLAYGQTGSGKTHTILGPKGCISEFAYSIGKTSDWGIFPRTMIELFENLEKHKDVDMNLSASAVEIYFNNIFDLLANRARISIGSSAKGKFLPGTSFGDKSRRMWGRDRWGNSNRKEMMKEERKFHLKGEKEITLKNLSDVVKFSKLIEATRIARSTKMNDRSSRSHCVITVKLTQINKSSKMSSTNRFIFVDLAGSERIKKSGVSGTRKTEATSTNYSLTCLGRTIHALSQNEKFIPYRESSLTLLLKNVFGGNCHTHMIVTISQEKIHGEETFSTLLFGKRSSKVKNITKRIIYDVNVLRNRLKREIEECKNDIEHMEDIGISVCGGINKNAPKPTQDSFWRNKKLLHESEEKVRFYRQQRSELISRGVKNESKEFKQLEEKLEIAVKAVTCYSGIIIRMIFSGLYKKPKMSYIRKKEQLKNLLSELKKYSM